MNKEVKRILKKKKYVIIIFTIFTIFIILLLVVVTKTVTLTYGEDICDFTVHDGSDWFIDGKIGGGEEAQLTYYKNVEDSLEAAREEDIQEKETSRGSEIVRIEKGDYLFVLFRGEIKGGIKALPCIYHAIFKIKNGNISYPLYYWCTGVENTLWNSTKTYHEEDRITRDIANAYYKADVTSKANGGIPIYYGVGVEAKTKQLTILGVSPTKIIPFEYKGKTYYLWYYLEEKFGKIYEEKIKLSVTTMEEMAELFDIQFNGRKLEHEVTPIIL